MWYRYVLVSADDKIFLDTAANTKTACEKLVIARFREGLEDTRLRRKPSNLIDASDSTKLRYIYSLGFSIKHVVIASVCQVYEDLGQLGRLWLGGTHD